MIEEGILASIVQSVTRSHDILGHLAHSSDDIGIEKVVVPSINRSQVVKEYWIGGNRRWVESVGSGHVFIKGKTSAECTDDTRKLGYNKEIAKAIAHLIVSLLSAWV
jgi:hypothetical protein